MIVIDTSALVAIIEREPERIALVAAIEAAATATISVANAFELHLVMSRRQARFAVAELLAGLNINVQAVDVGMLAIVAEAHDRFGSGAHGLNLGDCFAYALARTLDAPLLFKGKEFARTDIEPVAY